MSTRRPRIRVGVSTGGPSKGKWKYLGIKNKESWEYWGPRIRDIVNIGDQN